MRQKFYSDTGFVRICLMLYDHKYYDEMKKLHFKKNKPLFDLIDEKLKGQGGFQLYKLRLYEKNDLYVDVWRGES